MSEISKKVYKSTKWSERGYTPNFKETHKILLKAAKRTYKGEK